MDRSSSGKWMWLSLGIAVVVVACSPAETPPTTHTTGDHAPTGTNVGAIDVNGDGTMDGTGYDSNGDGRADEIDIDGDNVVDGEDNNGDGTITLWDDLGTGAIEPTAEQEATQIPETDPDFDQMLDPANPPDSVDPATGEVTPPPRLILGEGISAESQGQQGSCAAFANAALATIVRHEREGGDFTSEWASPAFLYAYQVPASMSSCGEGTFIQTGLDVLVQYGAATRAEVPYRSGDMPMLCEMDPGGATPDDYRIGGYESIRPFDSAHIREAIAAGSPVAFGTPLTQGFFSLSRDAADAVFDFGSDPCTGMHCGGHAMVIVGYDDAMGAFRVLNSWGEDWGDSGFYWLAYDYFDRGRPANEVYGFAITLLPGAPTMLGTPDATTFAAEVMGAPVLRVVDGTPTLTVRGSFTEPVRLTGAALTDSAGATLAVTFDQWIVYGNIALMLTSMPAEGAAMLHLDGALRDDSPVTADLPIDVPPPAADADGAN